MAEQVGPESANKPQPPTGMGLIGRGLWNLANKYPRAAERIGRVLEGMDDASKQRWERIGQRTESLLTTGQERALQVRQRASELPQNVRQGIEQALRTMAPTLEAGLDKLGIIGLIEEGASIPEAIAKGENPEQILGRTANLMAESLIVLYGVQQNLQPTPEERTILKFLLAGGLLNREQLASHMPETISKSPVVEQLRQRYSPENIRALLEREVSDADKEKFGYTFSILNEFSSRFLGQIESDLPIMIDDITGNAAAKDKQPIQRATEIGGVILRHHSDIRDLARQYASKLHAQQTLSSPISS